MYTPAPKGENQGGRALLGWWVIICMRSVSTGLIANGGCCGFQVRSLGSSP